MIHAFVIEAIIAAVLSVICWEIFRQRIAPRLFGASTHPKTQDEIKKLPHELYPDLLEYNKGDIIKGHTSEGYYDDEFIGVDDNREVMIVKTWAGQHKEVDIHEAMGKLSNLDLETRRIKRRLSDNEYEKMRSQMSREIAKLRSGEHL